MLVVALMVKVYKSTSFRLVSRNKKATVAMTETTLYGVWFDVLRLDIPVFRYLF